MADLKRCGECPGFVPSLSRVCPHCGAAQEVASRGSAVGTVLRAAAAIATAATLAACYGPPTPPEDSGQPMDVPSSDTGTE
jgi:hypothetical protein